MPVDVVVCSVCVCMVVVNGMSVNINSQQPKYSNKRVICLLCGIAQQSSHTQFMHSITNTCAMCIERSPTDSRQKEQKMQTIFIYIIECLALLLLQGIHICRYVLYHSIVILCRLTACVCVFERDCIGYVKLSAECGQLNHDSQNCLL